MKIQRRLYTTKIEPLCECPGSPTGHYTHRKTGDRVKIVECRPMSKDKNFKLLEIVK